MMNNIKIIDKNSEVINSQITGLDFFNHRPQSKKLLPAKNFRELKLTNAKKYCVNTHYCQHFVSFVEISSIAIIDTNYLLITIEIDISKQQLWMNKCNSIALSRELSSDGVSVKSKSIFIAVYNLPIWKKVNFSGDLLKCKGPLTNMHFSSNEEAGTFIVIADIAWSKESCKHYSADILKLLCLAQLNQFFGESIYNFRACSLNSWRTEPWSYANDENKALLVNQKNEIPILDLESKRQLFAFVVDEVSYDDASFFFRLSFFRRLCMLSLQQNFLYL